MECVVCNEDCVVMDFQIYAIHNESGSFVWILHNFPADECVTCTSTFTRLHYCTRRAIGLLVHIAIMVLAQPQCDRAG